MTIDEKAEDIAKLIIAERFEYAKAKWKLYTTGMTAHQCMTLRNQIEVIEYRIISGFDDVKNAETGPLY